MIAGRSASGRWSGQTAGMSSLGVEPPAQPRRVPSGRRAPIVPDLPGASGGAPGGAAAPGPVPPGRLTSGQRAARRHAEDARPPGRPARGRVPTGRRVPVALANEAHAVVGVPRRPGGPGDRRPAYTPPPAYLHR
jgi:hypothetical protein